ncbi:MULTISPECIES: ABC transporter ATP-binding protein [Trueperella]|uniref:ABC transport system ATP-binding protein n=1 Tax=Trueperella abortisuis TaxID=445930 RepID=A0ABT9PFW9_9ACTO|nr:MULTISPECIES: ABC transporter ATP-binding protein [Trueperella]MCI7305534.1 ABC transporter ATP-binding protein [Trueperella sp.]MDP9831609.1 putative ABC transport system ATP-binding protein [Trueperella abortisuis]MDY5403889.1 ABC transporter ATP-binding protein [Trueperella sp.]
MEEEIAVRTSDLSKLYKVGRSHVVALNRVNLEIPKGTFVAVVGTSGSGKSTLLNMLAGLEPPSAGTVEVAGYRVDKMGQADLASFRRDHVGFVFQSFNLMQEMTALDNVALPLTFRGMGKAERHKRAARALTILGLGTHLHHRPSQMSGGEQQRVGIARALVTNPEIVFADEPTGNLDSHTAAATLDLFRRLIAHYHQTWIMVTHDRHLASYADVIVSIGDGRITDITHTNHTH